MSLLWGGNEDCFQNPPEKLFITLDIYVPVCDPRGGEKPNENKKSPDRQVGRRRD